MDRRYDRDRVADLPEGKHPRRDGLRREIVQEIDSRLDLAIPPWLSFAQHPYYLAALALAVPVIHEFHFFCIHRLIHTPFLYKRVHSVHHNSVNPSPWSSLSMHPVEHLLYFSTAFYHHPFEPGHRALPASLCLLRRDSRSCRLRQDRGGRERFRR
jgi:hypothetical protein